MGEVNNIYCDESCYQPNDHHVIMALGAVWCQNAQVVPITARLREIKKKHGVDPYSEIKWTRVSPGKLSMYQEIIEFFFDEDHLHFRGVVVPDKSLLRHELHGQTHDDWHYKMWFVLLSRIFTPKDEFRVYLDIKDSHGAMKARRLHEVLCNSQYDFSRKIIQRLEIVRSEQVELMQLTDLILGCIAYANRGLETSRAKLALVEVMRRRSGYNLLRTTLLLEPKLNLLRWNASGATE